MCKKNFSIKKEFSKFINKLQNKNISFQEKNDIIYHFRAYFEGVTIPNFDGNEEFDGRDEVIAPIVNIKIERFQINKIDFFQNKGVIIMKIGLGRPGLIIGKGGSLIKGLTGYISKQIDHPFKIELYENDIWKRHYSKK